MLQEPSHQPMMDTITTFFCWQCLAITITLMEFGSRALVLTQAVCCCCCWTASCRQGIGVSSVNAKIDHSFDAALIVVIPVAFVQYVARAVPSTYNGPNCYLFCWQCLAITITLMDFGSKELVLARVGSYCCCQTACCHQGIGVPSVYAK